MGIFKVKNPETGEWESVKVVKGDPGKSAYEFAKDGGYVGTEGEFSAKLAEVTPKAFYVDIFDNGDMTGTLSKPYEEIIAAFEAGKPIVAALYIDSVTAIGNVMLSEFDGMLMGSCAGWNANAEPSIYSIVIYQDGVTIAGFKCAPENLPNPHKLIFTGAAAGEYDGSGEVTINIPASGSDTETVLSDNLFDKSAAAYGQCFYYGSSGYQMVSEDLKYYSFVPLRGAGTYRTKFMKTVHFSTGARIALVNDDNQWVTNVTGTLGDAAADSNFVDFEFVVTPAMIAQGVTKVAFDVYSIHIDQVMLVKDREYPSEYIPYGYIEIATESGRKTDNVLCEKTAVFLGDSICAGTTVLAGSPEYGYGWGGLIGEANKMVWKNYGQNGAVITSSITETNRYIPNQADTAIAEHPQADYVIFDGGTNDSAYTELGTLAKAGYAPTDYANFTNAFESLLLKLLTAFPKAKIGYIIPPKMNRANDFSSESNTYRQFFDRAIEICEKWGVPYLDLWKLSPMNPMLSVHYDSTLTADQANEQGKLYTDGQHLTLAGYQRITPQIEAWMRNL